MTAPPHFLLYKEPDCPLEYALSPLLPLKMVWAINPSERLENYCTAQSIPFANLAAKKQSDIWRWLDKKDAQPCLLFVGFQQQASNRLHEFIRTVELINHYCQKRDIPILLDRSCLMLHEVPWLLGGIKGKQEKARFLEIAMSESFNPSHLSHYKALHGSVNWMDPLSKLPAFMRELSQQRTLEITR